MNRAPHNRNDLSARREFLRRAMAMSAVPVMGSIAPGLSVLYTGGAAAAAGATEATTSGADYGRLLILVELKGGNDGLNTLVPFADPAYASLRPRIAQRREDLLHISEREGLHPSLAALQPLWQGGELALIRGVGYPRPNLSHFRSIEIWDTASASEEYLAQGWVARAFAAHAVPRAFAADGVVIGSGEAGPLSGGGRVVTLASTEQFLRQARLATPGRARGSRALEHVLKVEGDIAQAAATLGGGEFLKTQMPEGPFGNAVRNAAQVLAGRGNVAAMRLTLNGFDTHQNQPGIHANLLKQLGDGLSALKGALVELGRWDSTLVLTYSEFGRRVQENGSNGTDHGTANVHFVLGGKVRGGLYGEAPRLDRLEDGNLVHVVDFRSLCATALQRWWRIEPASVLGGRFAQLDLLKV